MSQTSIEWTRNRDGTPGKTWNNLAGCTRISPGCKNCYAQRIAYRFSEVKGSRFLGLARMGNDGPNWTGEVRELSETLEEPLRWRKPQRVFVNSMSDLFHDQVSNEYIAAVFGIMAACPQHEFMVLTKRAARLPEWFRWMDEHVDAPLHHVRFAASDLLFDCGSKKGPDFPEELSIPQGKVWPLPNVWIGTSVEDGAHRRRIDDLRAVPAALRFLSIEPLLESVGLLDLRGIGWVITGAESGRGARPMEEQWVREIQKQCESAKVPFFYKQKLDEKGHKVGRPELDGVVHDVIPEAT